MNFDLTPDQRHLGDTIRDFCAKEIAPKARAWDHEERFPTEIKRTGDARTSASSAPPP